MVCEICKKRSVFSAGGLSFCEKCFQKHCLRRVRKYLRFGKFFKKNTKVLVVSSIAHEIVKKCLARMPVRIEQIDYLDHLDIKQLKKIRPKKDTVLVLPWTADDEIWCFIKYICENKKEYLDLLNCRHVKLFRQVLYKELEYLGKILDIDVPARKKDYLSAMIDSMQEKYPQTKFSIINIIDKLENK